MLEIYHTGPKYRGLEVTRFLSMGNNTIPKSLPPHRCEKKGCSIGLTTAGRPARGFPVVIQSLAFHGQVGAMKILMNPRVMAAPGIPKKLGGAAFHFLCW